MQKTDVLIIGGGPCGLAAAVGASRAGAKSIILERDSKLGGILKQCIHNGFGLHLFNEELTGPEYAKRWIDKVNTCKDVTVCLNSFAYDIEKNGSSFVVSAYNEEDLIEIEAKSVVLALGCRERPSGAILLAGSRPSGIFTAGCAQKLINIDGKSVGKRVVILGSGDIGLIMARRLTCEGAKVVGIYEIMPQSGGLARNITQCVQDFNIPLHLSTTITRTVGKDRLEGVYVAPVNERLKPVMELEKFVPCDTLLLSVGLLPEIEIAGTFKPEWCPATNSYVVDEYFQTNTQGLFCAGNVLHVNDLVDNVSREGEDAGYFAGLNALNKLKIAPKLTISFDEHIKYTVPKYIYNTGEGEAKISFRVNKNYRRTIIRAMSGGQEISRKPTPAVTAGEMQTVVIDKSKLADDLHLEIQIL
ncbi:MAG: FAD-dependent oxidoreductase [Clostridia bacterium]|nr:FAD-dependent oxidoreductase [Clostridia bacterium]